MTCAWDLSRALHPRLAASGRGAIVNVGSVAGQVSVGTGAVYAMSKAAIEHLTRYLAVEWARDGIRVNAVAPWYIRTPLVEPILGDPATLARVLAVTPMGRVGEPHEAAAAIVFLCLPAASFVTGQVLAADGGFLPTASARGRRLVPGTVMAGTSPGARRPAGKARRGRISAIRPRSNAARDAARELS